MNGAKIIEAISALNAHRSDLSGAFEAIARRSMTTGKSAAEIIKGSAYKQRARRDKKRSYNADDRARIYERDGGICFHCGGQFDLSEGDIDHIIPWSKGGKTNDLNGVFSCAHHNRSKGAKLYCAA